VSCRCFRGGLATAGGRCEFPRRRGDVLRACFLERRMQVEPYIAIDPVWGWISAFYMGIPVICLFVLLFLGSVGAPHILISRKKKILYPILSIIRNGARREPLLIES